MYNHSSLKMVTKKEQKLAVTFRLSLTTGSSGLASVLKVLLLMRISISAYKFFVPINSNRLENMYDGQIFAVNTHHVTSQNVIETQNVIYKK